ncbi:Serine/threonine-protein kinase TIO [Bienertia sinuspersici]
MLNQVMLAVKKFAHSGPLEDTDVLKKILVHVKTCSLVDKLCLSLATAGGSQSANFLCAASEGCIALWSLVDALENLSVMEKCWTFPLTSLRSQSLFHVDTKDCDELQNIAKGSKKVVETITRAFLNSEPVRVAIFYCFRQRIEEVLIAEIQLLLRCCMQSGSLPSVLCGLPRSLPVATVISGGGEGTFVSEIFAVISLCGSYMDKDSPSGEANGSKCKYTNIDGLALHSCLLLATIAQSFNSAGGNSAVFILTSSVEKQQSRLSSLAYLYSVNGGMITSLQPHLAAAMLAFASILLIEIGASAVSSVPEIAMPLIPSTSTLCDLLKINHKNGLENNCTVTNSMLSHWHGVRDGCIGLLKSKLRWGGMSDLKEFCAAGLPQLLMDLLGIHFVNNPATDYLSDLVGLSPVGVVWAVSCLSHCLSSSVITFQQMMLEKVHVKCINDLISGAHLKLLRSWGGPGGGKNGVREIIGVAIDFLAFPFVALENALGFPSATASMNSEFLLNVSSPVRNLCCEDGDITKAMKESMDKYVEILLEVGVPILVLQCADILGFEDTIKPIAFLSKMISCKALATCLVRKGMLEAARMRRLLDKSCPKGLILDMLMIVSDLARMHVCFYKYIERADILIRLKELLTSNDFTVRAKACCVVGNMCRHSSYFYDPLARHGIISVLIDRCTDPDKHTRKFACFAKERKKVGNAAFHNDLLYEELRTSISALKSLLLSSEKDVTTSNAAGALSNLVRHSNKLCDDIMSEGVIQALLKVVCECSQLVWNSQNMDATDVSPLKNALCALARMCACYSPCRNFICKSESFQVIAQLQQLPELNVAKYARIICTTAAGASELTDA